jgi:flagellar FliJ protein
VRRFSFSLEKVLELREYREQETEIALGRAVGELTTIENHLKELALQRLKAGAERFNPGNDALAIRNYEFYIQRLDHIKEELLEAAAKAQLKVEEARELYLEASRQRKVLDKLKEKRAVEYRKTMFAEETKMLDSQAPIAAGQNLFSPEQDQRS